VAVYIDGAVIECELREHQREKVLPRTEPLTPRRSVQPFGQSAELVVRNASDHLGKYELAGVHPPTRAKTSPHFKS